MQSIQSDIENGKYKRALKSIEKQRKILSPQQYFQFQGICYFHLKNYSRALHYYLQLVNVVSEPELKAKTYLQLARIYEPLQQNSLVIQSLRNAVDCFPSLANKVTRYSLCKWLHAFQEWELLDKYVIPLLGLSEYFVECHIMYSTALVEQGMHDKALERIRYLTAHFNHIDIRPLTGLLLQLNKLSVADYKTLLTQISTKFSSEPTIIAHLGNLAMLEKRYDEAARLFSSIDIDTLPEWFNSAWLLEKHAKTLDYLGKYNAAMERFSLTGRAALANQKSLVQSLRSNDILPKYQKLDLSTFRPSAYSGFSPAFLMGFARSGTTLLENVLASSQRIVTLQEPRTIMRVMENMQEADPQTIERGFNFNDVQLDAYREGYFSTASMLAEYDQTNCLLDKQPLNTLHLPLINKLFPQAKILFTLRHPLDVCLSCFMQAFRLNLQTVHFTSLKATFERYTAIMELFDYYQKSLDLNIHIVKYENIVSNFDNETRDVFNFLDVEIPEGYQQFHQKAAQKYITTPSRDQVSQPIYATSKYRWKNYREQIEPLIPLIQPYIDKFEYEV